MQTKTFAWLLLFISTIGHSQITDFEWAGLTVGVNTNRPSIIHVDPSENIYTAGRFDGNIRYIAPDGTTSLAIGGADNLFIQKVDAAGNLSWLRQINSVDFSSTEDILTDSEGNLYVGGEFTNRISLEGDGFEPMVSQGPRNSFLVKFDVDGNPVWQLNFGNENRSTIEAMAVDQEDAIYVLGEFEGVLEFDAQNPTITLDAGDTWASFIAKYDSDGNVLWARTYTATASEGSGPIDAVINEQNQLVVVGAFRESITFLSSALEATFSTMQDAVDGYMLKFDLDQDGLLIAAHEVGDVLSGQVSMNGVATDAMGNIYVECFFSGALAFDNGVVVEEFEATLPNSLVVKFDVDGEVNWIKQFEALDELGRVTTGDIEVDEAGNVVLVGGFTGRVDFDLSPDNSFELNADDGTNNNVKHFITYLSPEGEWINTYQYAGEGAYTFGGVVAVQAEHVYIAGGYARTIDINPLPDVTQTVMTENAGDAYLIKLQYDVPVSIPVVAPESSLSIFPNPTRDQVTLMHLSIEGPYRLMNTLGQVVQSGWLAPAGQTELSLHALGAGIYWLRTRTHVAIPIIKY
ncbi:MAG: hypothetical protein AAF798_14465 [Bacteroidota bacterium]